MFRSPLQKQFIDAGRVYCPRRARDVESDVCACCRWRAEIREDAKPPYVICEAERKPVSPSGWHSGWQADPHLISCRVALELEGRHRHKGRRFVVRIDLKVPGGEIVADHQHDEDPDIALREAFHAARRMLEDHVRRRRGDVKRHAPSAAPGNKEPV